MFISSEMPKRLSIQMEEEVKQSNLLSYIQSQLFLVFSVFKDFKINGVDFFSNSVFDLPFAYEKVGCGHFASMDP